MSKLARAYDALNIFNPDESLAEKLMGVVCAERQWLDATTGLDEDVVDAILTSGAVIALANVYQATALHDEEALIGFAPRPTARVPAEGFPLDHIPPGN